MSDRSSSPSMPPVAAELCAAATALDDMVDVYSLEVSLESMFVPTARRLPVGSVVTLNIRTRGGLPDLKAIARVTAVTGTDPDVAEPSGVRLQFLDLRPQMMSGISTGMSLAPAKGRHAARVLVVDDDDTMRGEAERAMQQAGHEVLLARNGVEALSVALSEEVDLVLTDVTMPSMDGWQLLRLLRSRTRLEKLPVIFLTRLTSDVERLKGYELGVSDYIDKPFQLDDLLGRVNAQLAKRRSSIPEDAPKVLRGDLAQVALSSLLSLIEMERRTGVLRLDRDGERATLSIRRGIVIRIDLPPVHDHKRGLARFFHVLDWVDGNFELSAVAVDDEAELDIATSYALLAHAKEHDEQAERAG